MHNNRYLISFLIMLLFGGLFPQFSSAQFSVELRPVTWANAPGVHSFATGYHNGKWLIIGGRVDGLHQRHPFDSFLASDNNTHIFVIDPANKKSWAVSLNSLSPSLQEQLQSTNMEFEQRGDMLYIIGGYGYSASAGDHVTYGNLTAVDVPATIDAIVNGQSIAPHFRQIADARMRVTGGYLDRIGEIYYLVGGQDFQGRYNPHGPNHGPGFYQKYTDEIRKFEILDNGTTLTIANYSVQTTTLRTYTAEIIICLHRSSPVEVLDLLPFPGCFSTMWIFPGSTQWTLNPPVTR